MNTSQKYILLVNILSSYFDYILESGSFSDFTYWSVKYTFWHVTKVMVGCNLILLLTTLINTYYTMYYTQSHRRTGPFKYGGRGKLNLPENFQIWPSFFPGSSSSYWYIKSARLSFSIRLYQFSLNPEDGPSTLTVSDHLSDQIRPNQINPKLARLTLS